MIHSAELNLPLTEEQCDLLKILAHTYLQQNLADKAVILLHAVYAVYPADVLVRTLLAFAYNRCGRPHEAILLLDWHSAEAKLAPQIHLLRSQAYSQMGRIADASAAMRHFINARSTSERGDS
jgi:predicted Zn-dependent protease